MDFLQRHMDVAHPKEIVVYKKFQHVGNVALVRLEHSSHDRSGLKQIGGSFDQVGIVELYSKELVLACMIAIVGDSFANRYPVDMLIMAVGLSKRCVETFIDAFGELLHQAFNFRWIALRTWNKEVWKYLLGIRQSLLAT